MLKRLETRSEVIDSPARTTAGRGREYPIQALIIIIYLSIVPFKLP